jgi:hypothetical protein
MTEYVAKYIYDQSISFGFYRVYACYDSMEDFDKRNVAFYDIYDSEGNCINEGDPFHYFPTWDEIYRIYWLPTVREASQTLSRDLSKATNDEY